MSASASAALSLAELRRGRVATVEAIGGERPFRRRLMEMGLVPGTRVAVVNVAPLGDPIEIELRHGRMSIRRHEASLVSVRP
ncbi:MAG TPA: FeoA family protein [Kofleriaceae bacterium]|nr:FeoA family protein [Kofleriaceae bacterium]